MSRSRYLMSNVNVINVLLAGLLALFLMYFVVPVFHMDTQYPLPEIKRSADEEPVPEAAVSQEKSPSPSDYLIVAEQNLFHPERKIPVEKKAEAPLPKPDFVLYGTLVADDVQIAYMEDIKAPQASPGRGKRQVPLRKGDTLSGFVLKEIQEDKVTLLRGEEKMVVHLVDPLKPKTREGVITTSSPPTAPTLKPAVQQPTAGRQATSQGSGAAAVQPKAETTQPAAATRPAAERRGSQAGRLFRPSTSGR